MRINNAYIMENEEFRLVNRRSRRGRANRFNRDSDVVPVEGNGVGINNDADIDCEAVYRKVLDAEIKLRNSMFWQYVYNGLKESIDALNINGISEILCYGLGRFSCNRASLYQLALLVSLKQYYDCRSFIYDPAFFPKEIEILKRFGFDIIENNEEGKRVVNEQVTLVYMPHCSKRLTNNFLYANWSRNISNLILISNSFSLITDNSSRRGPQSDADYISRLVPYVTEIALRSEPTYNEVFNDLNIHIFLERNIERVSRDFWATIDEPSYSNRDVEFLTADETDEAER